MYRSWTNYYYHTDGLGNVTEITDGSGNLVEQYSYDVYGKPTIRDGSTNVLSASAIGNRLMFNARDRDPDTLLYNYRYRYYSPGLGRFMQPDPILRLSHYPLGDISFMANWKEERVMTTSILESQQTNLYIFVDNSPMTWVDNWGLKKDPACVVNICLKQYQQDVDYIFYTYSACMAAVAATCMEVPLVARWPCYLRGAAFCGGMSIALHTAAGARLTWCIYRCPCVP
jgi:RHS repeat-associated protein